MDQPNNPYAPPATSDAPPDPLAAEPSRPDHHRPARLLWPLLVLRFLSATTWMIQRLQSTMLFQKLDFRTTGAIAGYSYLGGSLLAAPLTALLGDRRPAKMIMLTGLALLGAAALSLLLRGPTSSIAVASAITTGACLGLHLVSLTVSACLLRAVAVRGAYVVIMLETMAIGSGSTLANASLSYVSTEVSLGGAVGLALLAALMLIWVRSPDQATVSAELDDPLAQPPLSVAAGLLLVFLLGCYGALSSLVGALGYSVQWTSFETSIYERLPSILWLVLPFLAYARRWRPKGFLVAAMLTTSLGGLLIALPGLMAVSAGIAVIGRAVLSFAANVLAQLGMDAVIRQNLPKERLALWLTAVYMSWALQQTAFFQVRRLDPALVLIGISAIVFALALGSLTLLRGR